MSRKVRNLAITAAAPLVLLFLVWNSLASDPSAGGPPPPAQKEQPVPATPEISEPEPSEKGKSYRLYSIGAYRLKGLSPASPPGTSLEIWVSWSPKIANEPKLQKLVPRVLLESIVPGATPEAPSIVTLRLPVRALPDLIWGELFGELAVATRPD